MSLIFRQLMDAESSTLTYVLGDPWSKEAVIIDPVMGNAERDLATVQELGLRLVMSLETHVHADHVTAGDILRARSGCCLGVSQASGARRADRYFEDGDAIRFGLQALEVRSTPGHTAGCIAYVNATTPMVFTGDALLIRGCGRTDFQGGCAKTLFRSVRDKLFSLKDSTLVYPAHDYKGRTVSSIREEKVYNPRLKSGTSEAEFVCTMDQLNLAYPRRIDVSLPANMESGMSQAGAVLGPVETSPTDSWAVSRTPTGAANVIPVWVANQLKGIRLVDIREPDEWTGSEGRLAGAHFIPMSKVVHESVAWSKDEQIVLYCRSGGRSDGMANELESHGFRRVASMKGGVLMWAALGLPLEGDEQG
jgi:sulfur dioxygenase